MRIPEIVSKIINDRGVTQTWVAQKMNEANPSLKMDSTKFSAIVNETRKMSGDELLAFCLALGINPDIFIKAD